MPHIAFQPDSPMRKIVVKVGTSLLTNKDNTLHVPFLATLVEQISQLHAKNISVVLVTSGSVASGRSELTLKKESRNIPYRQALSAVGQNILMHRYRDLFAEKHIKVAQALLTELDFRDRESFLNARNSLNLLLDMRVVPIVNENDVVSYAGLKFGGNDWLAAKLSVMIGADLMILMTDIDGLYTDDPRVNPKAEHISEVRGFTDKIKKMAKNTSNSKSLGGMITKVEAAEYAGNAGIPTIIVKGRADQVLLDIAEGREFMGTVFHPTGKKSSAGHRGWLRSHLKKGASLVIDDGAVKALRAGGSLLPVGVKKVLGKFSRGDILAVRNLKQEMVAFGQVHYSSEDAAKIKGCRTAEMAELLGENLFEEELIHRDDMVVRMMEEK